MITFFACPKPFHGHIAVIQRNAIKSWTLLRPEPEIILLGDDEGVEETCKEFGLVHVAEIDRNEYGTPLVSSVFQIGQARASHRVVCYINSDILLTSDFMQAVQNVVARMPRFLVLGQRWDVDIRESWSFSSADWETDLRSLLAQSGRLHAPSGIDFFCFPKEMYDDIPPFAIGRLAWDNWLVWRARSKNIPIVDVTNATSIIHQNHDYSWAAMRSTDGPKADSAEQEHEMGRIKSDGRQPELRPEVLRNRMLVPEQHNLNIWAATWMVDRKGRIEKRPVTLTPSYLYYQLKWVIPLYWPALGSLIRWMLTIRTALLRGCTHLIRKTQKMQV
jgi:hypothetical protein